LKWALCGDRGAVELFVDVDDGAEGGEVGVDEGLLVEFGEVEGVEAVLWLEP
jgi:hypothetical protein